MPRLRRLPLTSCERATLGAARDHHPAPAVRERAAALLQVANGTPAVQVARTGLLRPRDPDTVYGWVTRYERQGLVGILGSRHGGARRRGPL